MRLIKMVLPALLSLAVGTQAFSQLKSHPALRPLPEAAKRPMGTGPAFFVDALKGSDKDNGSKDSPWMSIGFALQQINAGDTLYLRGGTYYEPVYCAVTGTQDKPITIRSYSGELAVIDGGFREFSEKPADAWQPVTGGAAGEFRSQRPFRNLRQIHGRFGDSMIGLQVYYYIEDLRGERYVGPGIWYNHATGHIHVRLAHYEKTGLIKTRTPLTQKYLPHRLNKFESYKGETDPRKLPLVIAPYHSVPLHIDGAQHVTFQDLVVRGGGRDAVSIRHGRTIEFDNVTIFAGAYGLRARNTGPLRIVNSAIRGSVPPWSTRGETSLREYPWRIEAKNLTRLNTHALLIPAAGDEYSVYYYPYNQRWEISHSEFTDAHDGVYLGDIDGVKFHHNYVHNFQDDGIYLSSFRNLHKPQFGPREIYQNVVTGCLMALAFGGDGHLTSDVHVFRNIIDGSTTIADHGSPPWESMRWYNNTILANPRFILSSRTGGRPWQVFNNLLLTGKVTAGKPTAGADWGGNVANEPAFTQPGDFRLPAGSAAIDSGVALPQDWSDPLRDKERGKPDAGAIPLGSGRLKVGRHGRLEF
jgi:hypothetical protein